MNNIFQLLRVKNWVKNLFVLAPLVFSMQMLNPSAVWQSVLAFIAFCFGSSFIYIINDIADRKADRLHPRKKNRPIADGRISVSTAIATSIVLVLVASAISIFLLPPLFISAILGYIILNTAYSFGLKRINIIEFICIAIGFVLRVVAGSVAIDVIPSHWIVVVTFFIALFLILIKRRSELVILMDDASKHRRILKYYTVEMIDIFLFISSTIVLISYILYTIDEKVIQTFGTDLLIYSSLFVLIGIFRFIQLGRSDEYQGEGDPTYLIFKDRFIQLTLLAWVIYVLSIIYIHQ